MTTDLLTSTALAVPSQVRAPHETPAGIFAHDREGRCRVWNRDNFTSEYYVVLPKMLATVMDLRGAFYAQLYVTITRSGSVMLWPVKRPVARATPGMRALSGAPH